MSLAFNPKDSNTFASACLDHTVKVWSLGSPTPNFTLEAHDKGVNYVDYYHGGDKPYLITTGDDRYVTWLDMLYLTLRACHLSSRGQCWFLILFTFPHLSSPLCLLCRLLSPLTFAYID